MTPGDTDWQPGQCLLVSKPGWIDEELPGNDGAFWAPTLVSPTVMYYAVSSMERDAQCIGKNKCSITNNSRISKIIGSYCAQSCR